MNYARYLLITIAVVVALVGISSADTLHVYYGLLHAHTAFSDGSGTPEEAFAAAKAAGLDFFAVTPHNHSSAEAGAKGSRRDGVLIATNHDLYNSTQPQTVHREWKENNHTKTEDLTAKSVVQAANDATTQNFVALFGQEFSTISSSNHINVIDYDQVIAVENGDVAGLVKLLDEVANGGSPPVAQMNHPDIHADLFYKGNVAKKKAKMFNDYGIDNADFGPEFSNFVADTDAQFHLIELLSGPAMKTTPTRLTSDHENDYYFYLVQGLHVSPSAGQDNHYKTWGTMNDIRTGVYADALTKAAILDAMRNQHTFATEDKNLEVKLMINDELMGTALTLDMHSPLDIVVQIKDADEPNADYDVELYYGTVEPENSRTGPEWKAKDGEQDGRERTGNGTVSFDGYIASGQPEFYYVKVTQSGEDQAWSAPVWINHAKASGQVFVWTKNNSSVYHQLGCIWADRIKTENRRTGTTPPAGRHLHACVFPENLEDDDGH